MVYNLRYKKAGRPEMDAKKTALAIAARPPYQGGWSLADHLGKSDLGGEDPFETEKNSPEERNLESAGSARPGVSSINEDDFWTMPPQSSYCSPAPTPAMVSEPAPPHGGIRFSRGRNGVPGGRLNSLFLRFKEYDISVIAIWFRNVTELCFKSTFLSGWRFRQNHRPAGMVLRAVLRT